MIYPGKYNNTMKGLIYRFSPVFLEFFSRFTRKLMQSVSWNNNQSWVFCLQLMLLFLPHSTQLVRILEDFLYLISLHTLPTNFLVSS